MHFFRNVNERIHLLEASWVSRDPVAFVCECSEHGCRAPVYLTVDEFRNVRQTRGHYVAVPTHVDPESEQIAVLTPRYAVLTRLEVEAATDA